MCPFCGDKITPSIMSRSSSRVGSRSRLHGGRPGNPNVAIRAPLVQGCSGNPRRAECLLGTSAPQLAELLSAPAPRREPVANRRVAIGSTNQSYSLVAHQHQLQTPTLHLTPFRRSAPIHCPSAPDKLRECSRNRCPGAEYGVRCGRLGVELTHASCCAGTAQSTNDHCGRNAGVARGLVPSGMQDPGLCRTCHSWTQAKRRELSGLHGRQLSKAYRRDRQLPGISRGHPEFDDVHSPQERRPWE